MNELHPLGELIQATQNEYGWSTRDMEREADRHGVRMAHSNFSRLKAEPVVAIKATQIQALAKVLRVSEQTVARAAIASMGVDLDAAPLDPSDALRSAADLSERDKRILLSVLTAMRHEESSDNAQPGSAAQDSTPPRKLRAVDSDADHPGAEQKTEDDEQQPPFGLLPWNADVDTSAVPPIDQVAAHPNFKSKREKWEEQYGERGEESQDPGDDF